jgi:hypothetical protein
MLTIVQLRDLCNRYMNEGLSPDTKVYLMVDVEKGSTTSFYGGDCQRLPGTTIEKDRFILVAKDFR